MKSTITLEAPASDLRHDLVSPLTAVIGFAHVLAMGDLKPEQRQAVDEILSAGQRLVQVIDERVTTATGAHL